VSHNLIYALNLADNLLSWTVITWVIIVGSCLVMMIWIVIYSYFDSPDFVEEVTVLFGGVTFWAAVLLSVAISLSELPASVGVVISSLTPLLAPRYLVKFISTSYMPLDRDIVREMWVSGDLKDRLGIQHRKQRSPAMLEAAPMLSSPHLRSLSEADHPTYQPVNVASPGSSVRLAAHLAPSPPSTTPLPEKEDEHSQYLVVGPPYQEVGTHASTSPSPLAPSPDPSYYSASFIPVPSPLPNSQVAQRSPDHTVRSHMAPAHSATSESYEMVVRSPPPDRGDLSRASEFTLASWTTAREYSEGIGTPTHVTSQGQAHDRHDDDWMGGHAV
jgi:phospholipid-translocating ATPase